jgi:hypothetical protein
MQDVIQNADAVLFIMAGVAIVGAILVTAITFCKNHTALKVKTITVGDIARFEHGPYKLGARISILDAGPSTRTRRWEVVDIIGDTVTVRELPEELQ